MDQEKPVSPLAPCEALSLLTASLRHLPPSTFGTGSPRRTVLAVSGGPDSLALLHAAYVNADALRRQGEVFHVVTVDHALRDASAAEVAHVAALSRAHGMTHETRRWDDRTGGGNRQSEARRARYGLLTQAALDAGAAAVMTAHHQDDQIETHFLALARQSGDRGLAAMRPARELAPGVRLLRPFLDIAGARLKATVAKAGLAAIDDPSNRDARYDRVRIRQTIEAGDLDRRSALAAIAHHAARRDAADMALAAALSSIIEADLCRFEADGSVLLDVRGLAGLEHGALPDLLARILVAVGGRDYPPDRCAVERLAAWLDPSSPAGATAVTLGGVLVERGATITFSREFGRTGPAGMPIRPATKRATFDGRFDIDLARLRDKPSGAIIAPFGSLGIGNRRTRTLPVVLDAERRPLAAPQALLPRLPKGTMPLVFAERVSWRCRADLPANVDRVTDIGNSSSRRTVGEP